MTTPAHHARLHVVFLSVLVRGEEGLSHIERRIRNDLKVRADVYVSAPRGLERALGRGWVSVLWYEDLKP